MTTQELINKANELAKNKWEAKNEIFGERRWLPNSLNEIDYKRWKEADAMPDYAKFNNVICESTICFKGSTVYFQNRFYKIKEDGRRGIFSKTKAFEILG